MDDHALQVYYFRPSLMVNPILASAHFSNLDLDGREREGESGREEVEGRKQNP